MNLIWSPQSLEDRKQIYAFIFEHDNQAADALDDLFDNQANRLLTFSEMGKPGRIKGTRELVVHKHYLLVYTCSPGAIRVVTVLHTSRQYPA
ncbi:type II toxin-antitoxin system RelE/ParE family toxin [Desulfovibrio intestinalis]|uniref:Addiction module RelE/StbE family toxin n=1 Tax=Desulfovibrio intestinalis TaxID=58621 RepID=A0A7W8C3T2_9BACT|nr:type II toxin-antitoxin system RelE/ParE family toxin [Desulfovibrio intestinalis]MBB5144796.1 addiction module RelE/StbE family toxin [Desulfovibrio intestinalis]